MSIFMLDFYGDLIVTIKEKKLKWLKWKEVSDWQTIKSVSIISIMIFPLCSDGTLLAHYPYQLFISMKQPLIFPLWYQIQTHWFTLCFASSGNLVAICVKAGMKTCSGWSPRGSWTCVHQHVSFVHQKFNAVCFPEAVSSIAKSSG